MYIYIYIYIHTYIRICVLINLHLCITLIIQPACFSCFSQAGAILGRRMFLDVVFAGLFVLLTVPQRGIRKAGSEEKATLKFAKLKSGVKVTFR